MDINATLLGEMLTFAVLIWATAKYIWPPIIRALNERQQKIAEGLEAAERGQHSLDVAQQEAAKQIRMAKLEVTKILDKADQQVRDLIEDGKLQARKEGAKLLHRTHCDIEREMIQAQKQLQQQTTALAVQIAEKVLREKLDSATQDKLISQLLKEIS